MELQRTVLDAGWKWRVTNTYGNKEAESVPGIKEWNQAKYSPSVIQMELLYLKLIPDYMIAENERLIQWVGEVDWEYACEFKTPTSVNQKKSKWLVFEGLDTVATVNLNGSELFQTENMFLSHDICVNGELNEAGESNSLSIVFKSPLKKSTELEVKYGPRKSMMRDRRRMHLRKAQCHWGWDWGPVVMTSGPYLPIYLDVFISRIKDLYITSALKEDLSQAEISVALQVSKDSRSLDGKKIEVTILDDSGLEVAKDIVNIKETAKVSFNITQPKLWWPNGQGPQSLYKCTARLLDSKARILDNKSTRFGIRTIKLIQRPLDNAPGKTFMFNVNGQDIFIQGGDWIPADNLLPSISRKRYFDWIEVAKRSHLNMLRVWGGGIYETEDFFDACDELGMLVWHDYAFACGDYPLNDKFLESIRQEAEIQTKRMRGRASLALLCGGNEDFMLADMENIKYDHHDVTGPFDDQPFPQRKIYLEILPEIAQKLCPDVQYWANSPWKGETANDLTVGDIHQWEVWHSQQLPYQQYKDISGRFVSEFGMHGFPVMRTVDHFVPNATDRHPQSKVIDCHNKGQGAETRIARYLAENFRYDNTKLENFAYASQLLQSEAYGYALRDWKRKFSGKGKEECAGAIIWQLNDIYPCTSWAYVDYYLRPKPAFYTIRRAFAPISVGIERTPRSRFINEDHPESKIPKFSIFAHNTTHEDVKAMLVLEAYDLHLSEWVHLPSIKACRSVTLKSGQNTELGTLKKQTAWTESSLIILEASIVSENGTVLSRIVDWPEPFRYLQWPKDTNVDIKVEKGDSWENNVTIISNQAVKGCWLEPVYDGTEKVDDGEPIWDDNMVDLLPNSPITLGVNGLRGRSVKVRFLGDWEL